MLDFDHDRRSAFMRGFWGGLAAPVALFVSHPVQAVPQVQQVVPPKKDAASAINGDWARVGDTIRTVIGRYEQEQEQQPSR